MRNRVLALVGLALLSAMLGYIALQSLSRSGSTPPQTQAPKTRGVPPLEEGNSARVGSAVGNVPHNQPPRGTPVPEAPAPAASPSIAKAIVPAFPWPPPAASTEYQIRNAWLTKGDRTKLSEVGDRLQAALEAADYETWKYSYVPHGFALITQLEQIRADGTPRSGKERFRADLPSLSDMSFVEFLKALARAPPGYYRVIVFIVSDVPFSQAEQKPTASEAQRWLSVGLNQLPKALGALAYGEGYRTTALIYEFKRTSKEEPATFVAKSAESGRTHLERAGIWDALTR